MALVVFAFSKKEKRIHLITGALLTEILMCLGYYIFEGFLYGFKEALINVPSNLIQGIFGVFAGLFLIGIFKKSKINF